jgi:hypothetical protein
VNVSVETSPGGGLVLILSGTGPAALYRIGSLDEHDLRDLEFVLAQRRAMSSRCPETDGRHTCSLRPGHGESHQCRGCEARWRHVPAGIRLGTP